ncbi:hypothetical protein HK405_007962, partial [Cladochytrium tenue]
GAFIVDEDVPEFILAREDSVEEEERVSVKDDDTSAQVDEVLSELIPSDVVSEMSDKHSGAIPASSKVDGTGADEVVPMELAIASAPSPKESLSEDMSLAKELQQDEPATKQVQSYADTSFDSISEHLSSVSEHVGSANADDAEPHAVLGPETAAVESTSSSAHAADAIRPTGPSPRASSAGARSDAYESDFDADEKSEAARRSTSEHSATGPSSLAAASPRVVPEPPSGKEASPGPHSQAAQEFLDEIEEFVEDIQEEISEVLSKSGSEPSLSALSGPSPLEQELFDEIFVADADDVAPVDKTESPGRVIPAALDSVDYITDLIMADLVGDCLNDPTFGPLTPLGAEKSQTPSIVSKSHSYEPAGTAKTETAASAKAAPSAVREDAPEVDEYARRPRRRRGGSRGIPPETKRSELGLGDNAAAAARADKLRSASRTSEEVRARLLALVDGPDAPPLASADFAAALVDLVMGYLPAPQGDGSSLGPGYAERPGIPRAVIDAVVSFDCCDPAAQDRLLVLLGAVEEVLETVFADHARACAADSPAAAAAAVPSFAGGLGVPPLPGRLLLRGGRRGSRPRTLPRVPAAALRDAVRAAVAETAAYPELHRENLDALLIAQVREDERIWRAAAAAADAAALASLPRRTPGREEAVATAAADSILDDLVADTAAAVRSAWAVSAAATAAAVS